MFQAAPHITPGPNRQESENTLDEYSFDDDEFTPKEGYGQTIFISLVGRPKIIRLDEHRVLKRANTNRHEADAMRFIAANTTTPVPHVHGTREIGQGVYEIVMDYVPGKPLDKAWSILTHEQKIATCGQLRGYLAQFKELQGNRIETVGGGAVTVGIRIPKEGVPFSSEKEFNEFMIERNERVPQCFKRYARALLKGNHTIHFAHADFSPRNVLVDENGRVTAVLDWDRVGRYPEYWD